MYYRHYVLLYCSCISYSIHHTITIVTVTLTNLTADMILAIDVMSYIVLVLKHSSCANSLIVHKHVDKDNTVWLSIMYLLIVYTPVCSTLVTCYGSYCWYMVWSVLLTVYSTDSISNMIRILTYVDSLSITAITVL